MPYSKEKLQRFFEVYTVHPLLNTAVQLLYKSEFEAAAREAFVTVENSLKNYLYFSLCTRNPLKNQGFWLICLAAASRFGLYLVKIF